MVFIFLESKHLLGRQAHSKDRPLLVWLLLLLFNIRNDCTRQATKFITPKEHQELQLLEEVFLKTMTPRIFLSIKVILKVNLFCVLRMGFCKTEASRNFYEESAQLAVPCT